MSEPIKVRIGPFKWYDKTLDLCEHIQIPNVSYNWNNPEYAQDIKITCKICGKDFNIEIGVN